MMEDPFLKTLVERKEFPIVDPVEYDDTEETDTPACQVCLRNFDDNHVMMIDTNWGDIPICFNCCHDIVARVLK